MFRFSKSVSPQWGFHTDNVLRNNWFNCHNIFIVSVAQLSSPGYRFGKSKLLRYHVLGTVLSKIGRVCDCKSILISILMNQNYVWLMKYESRLLFYNFSTKAMERARQFIEAAQHSRPSNPSGSSGDSASWGGRPGCIKQFYDRISIIEWNNSRVRIEIRPPRRLLAPPPQNTQIWVIHAKF